METMILVAGLVIMGLAGIAAAFYFSMRPGHAQDRAVPERRRPRGSASRGSRPSGNRPAASRGRTGPSTVLDFTDPHLDLGPPGSLVAGRRGRHADHQADETQDAATQQLTALSAGPGDQAGAARTPRSRRRVAWRKGTDVDQELWPAEEFGGVSDEQFWDDLAADRPLATTARTPQPNAAARRRPPQANRLPDLPPGEAGRRAPGRQAGQGLAAYPQRSQGTEDRTAAQPAIGARPAETTPLMAPSPAYQGRASYQAAPGRSAAAAGSAEDPLTSPAYALRPQGAVDGRPRGSASRAQAQSQAQAQAQARDAGGPGPGRARPEAGWTSPFPPERSWPGASGSYPAAQAPGPYPAAPAAGGTAAGGTAANPAYRSGSSDSYRGSTAYLYPQAYGEPLAAADTSGYGDADQAAPAGDPGYASGWNPGTAGGRGEPGRGTRPAYPPASGYRAPYDPGGR
jgi:hypothetical protein